MDDISRESPLDTTSGDRDVRRDEPRGKGPLEYLALERAQQREDLVVNFGGRMGGEHVPSGSGPEGQDGETPSDEGAAADGPEALPASSESELPADAIAAALSDEAAVAEIEEDLPDLEDGLPPVPELGDAEAVARIVFVLMLTSREGISLFRLAQACNSTQKLVEEALGILQNRLTMAGLPIELVRNGEVVKWLAQDETFVYLQRLRGVKKLEKLSPAALETLAVIAYRQPVMRSEIEAIRGVKAGPMLRTLLMHKLVRVTGRADVHGKPLQYGTTQLFLERFGLGSLQELPSIKEWKNLG